MKAAALVLLLESQALVVGKLVSPGAETALLLEITHFGQDGLVGFLQHVLSIAGTCQQAQNVAV